MSNGTLQPYNSLGRHIKVLLKLFLIKVTPLNTMLPIKIDLSLQDNEFFKYSENVKASCWQSLMTTLLSLVFHSPKIYFPS